MMLRVVWRKIFLPMYCELLTYHPFQLFNLAKEGFNFLRCAVRFFGVEEVAETLIDALLVSIQALTTRFNDITGLKYRR